MEKGDDGLVLTGDRLKPVTRGQKFQQWWYGVIEPFILRTADHMLSSEKSKANYVKMKKPKSLPSGIIISTEAACRFVDFIYGQNAENASARMAVTKCVCQTALKRYREPQKKDLALLYTSNLYTTAKNTGIAEPFERIETAEQAKEMIRYFDECGLLHNVLYCHSSGKWTFVMCNCDDEICVPFRSYMAGRTQELAAGPEIIRFESGRCVGKDACGKCLKRCILKATYLDENANIQVQTDKCLGCGLCVSTCQGKARTLIARDDYRHEDVLTTKILLGQDTTALP